MPYGEQTWLDGSSGGTPISAARLSHLEAGVGSTSDRTATTIDVKLDFGATGNGTTDDTAAIQAARNAVYAALGAGGAVSGFVELYFPPGVYLITQPGALINTPTPGTSRLRGLHIRGAGKGASTLQFSPTGSGDANALIQATNLIDQLRISDLTFNSTQSGASWGYFYSTSATAGNDDVTLERCEWTGTWNRGLALDGDATAAGNRNWTFQACSTAGTAVTFADAFLRSGITSPTTNTAQDAFGDITFSGCDLQINAGTVIRMDRGGRLTMLGGIAGIRSTSTAGTVFSFPATSTTRTPGTCRLQTFGTRFTLNAASHKVIDCHWTEGSVTFVGCSDSEQAAQSFAPTASTHAYDFNNGGALGGPQVRYSNCDLLGFHTVTTNAVTAPAYGVVAYEGCRPRNFTIALGSTGFLRSTGTQVPYRFTNCYGIADAFPGSTVPTWAQITLPGTANAVTLGLADQLAHVNITAQDGTSPNRFAFTKAGTLTGYFDSNGELRVVAAGVATVPLRLHGGTLHSTGGALHTANILEVVDNAADLGVLASIAGDGTISAPNIGNKITGGSVAPTAPNVGDVFVDTSGL